MIDYSFIIPCYNSSKTLKRLLESIPLLPNLEIILIDDNSSKEEYELEKEIAKDFEHNLIFRQTIVNKGAGAARNLGLSLAQGKWVIFIDSDDYFTKDITTLLLNNVNREEDIIYFNATSIKIPSSEQSQRHCQIDKWIKSKDEINLRFSFHGPVCKIIKRTLIIKEKIFFFESFAFNDALFSFKIGFYAKSIFIEDIPAYCITESASSTTYTINKKILSSRIQSIIAFNSFLKQVRSEKFEMPIFPHLFYARKLGFKGCLDMIWLVLKNKQNPFKGWKSMLR